MVECESLLVTRSVATIPVLIDTWWNVNTFKIYDSSVIVSVLIDTWWNVNDIDEREEPMWHEGINRYMVECELLSASSNFFSVISY